MTSELEKAIEALKLGVYYVDGRPNMSPYADKVNAKLDEALAIIRQHNQRQAMDAQTLMNTVVRAMSDASNRTGGDRGMMAKEVCDAIRPYLRTEQPKSMVVYESALRSIATEVQFIDDKRYMTLGAMRAKAALDAVAAISVGEATA